MEQEAWDKYCEGRKSYMTKHLTLCKNNKMNFCKLCERKFYIKATGQTCSKSKNSGCKPAYDFTIDDNVLNCAILNE